MNKKSTIYDYLAKQPLLFDGAMGTYLAEQYPEYKTEYCERFNVSHPELIREVHRAYLEAGAAAIKTNTFGANQITLQMEQSQVDELICRGWEIAGEVIEEFEGEHYLFADIGPVQMPEEQEALEVYRPVVDCFLQCGAKNFLFETFDFAEGLSQICEYIKEKVPDAFIMVSFGVSPEGFTRGGSFGRNLYHQMLQAEAVDAVGFNCISGPKHLLDLVKKLSVASAGKYITIMPNAGYPTMIGNRTYFGSNHRYFAEAMYEIAEQGVSVLGGCCGTGPADIQALNKVLQEKPIAGRSHTQIIKEALFQDIESQPELDRKNPRNGFAAKLERGERVLVVELDPPVEPEIDFFMEGAARYQRAGVDAIDIADCPVAKARIDSSILACKVTRELGLTTIPHMTCRDRNINATKALLLGLNIEGVNNVLTVTGDPVPAAERSQVKTVFSYNSSVLANHIRALNQKIFGKNPFMVSGALNINAINFDSQIVHARKKIENGVRVLFTQPVLNERGYENLKRAREELDVKILGGIMPVVSYRNACFMNNEMAGIDIDEGIIDAYRDKTREEGEELAWKLSVGVAEKIAPYVDGFYLITPFKRVELILRIIESIRSF